MARRGIFSKVLGAAVVAGAAKVIYDLNKEAKKENKDMVDVALEKADGFIESVKTGEVKKKAEEIIEDVKSSEMVDKAKGIANDIKESVDEFLDEDETDQ